MSISSSAWADGSITAPNTSSDVQAELAESLPLIGVDRVHRDLKITGTGVGIFIIDDWGINEEGYSHGQAVVDVIQAVAPGARLWLCKLDFPRVTEQDFSECLQRIVREHLPIRVVNLSFAVGEQVFDKPCDPQDDSLSQAIRQLSQMGVIFVAAAGNDGRKDALRFPACLPEVISVGATYDLTGPVAFNTDQIYCQDVAAVDKITCYSDVADYLDLVAPGTTVSTPSAPNFGGTSAATPLVSGVIALMLEAHPSLSEPTVIEVLRTTAAPAVDSTSSRIFPRVDAYRAVRAVLFPSGPPSAPPRSVAQFDTNGNGTIEDPEFFRIIDEWIAGRISDDLFFDVIDYWVQQLPITGHDEENPTQTAARIQLFDLQGKLIKEEIGASVGQLRSVASPLANGVYIYVATREIKGHLVRTIGKLAILR